MITRPRYYAFGPYVLDALRGVLWQDNAPVPLTPKVVELLVALVERPGEPLGKDDLIRRVWGDMVVEENNLARHISTLRKALHERPGQREFIVTIPGFGYRFVAAVQEFAHLPPGIVNLDPTPVAHKGGDPSEPVASSAEPRPAQSFGAWFGGDWINPLSGAVLTLAVVALAGTFLWRHSSGQSAPSSVQRALSQVTYEAGFQQSPAWAPDGERLAYASDQAGNADIWVQSLGSVDAAVRLTTSSANDWQPDWSPDGERIVFRSERDGGGLYVVPVRGGPETRIADFGTRPRWSPSGMAILFSRADPDSAYATQMYVVGADGQGARPIEHDALSDVDVINAGWCPDGRVSFWGRDKTGGWVFVTLPVGDGPATRSEIPPDFQDELQRLDLSLSNFVWAPSGRWLYFEGSSRLVRNLWRIRVAPVTLNWVGGPERLTTGPGADSGIAVSPDGRRLAFGVSTGRAGIWAFGFDPATGRINAPGEPVTSSDPGQLGVDASTDGRRLVYRASRNDRQELWEQSANGQPRLLLATKEWTHSPPRWSPDGTRIAFQRTRKDVAGAQADRAVSILSVAGREETLLPVSGQQAVIPAAWSSDGSSILAACRLASGERLGTCLLALRGGPGDVGQVQRLASDAGMDMVQQRFSPDQQWISFVGAPFRDRSRTALYVMPASGGAWTAMTDGSWFDDKPRWSPDGRTLYFVSNRDGHPEVWGRHFDSLTGRPVGELFRVTAFAGGPEFLSPHFTQMDMVVSERRLFLPMARAAGQIWLLEHVEE